MKIVSSSILLLALSLFTTHCKKQSLEQSIVADTVLLSDHRLEHNDYFDNCGNVDVYTYNFNKTAPVQSGFHLTGPSHENRDFQVRSIMERQCAECHTPSNLKKIPGENPKVAHDSSIIANIFDPQSYEGLLAKDPASGTSRFVSAIQLDKEPFGDNHQLTESEKKELMIWGSGDDHSLPSEVEYKTWSAEASIIQSNKINQEFDKSNKIPFVSLRDEHLCVEKDLNQQDPSGHFTTRYLSIAHIYNKGVRGEQLKVYRRALAKLVNSLSKDKEIMLPVPIDPLGLLYRIDIRSYRWVPAAWENVGAQSPYANMISEEDLWKVLSSHMDTKYPILRLDEFIANTLFSLNYHFFLDFPEDIWGVERMTLGRDTRSYSAHRGAFGVRINPNAQSNAQNPRLIEKYSGPWGSSYYKTYDFESVAGKKDIDKHPVPSSFSKQYGFQHDANEAIIQLPNGLFAFYGTDAKGLAKNPHSKVYNIDPAFGALQEKGAVMSCFACHGKGLIAPEDSMSLQGFNTSHAKSTNKDIFRIQKWLLDGSSPSSLQALSEAIEKDNAVYRKSIHSVGVPLYGEEPISVVFKEHQKPVDFAAVAAEFGISGSLLSDQLSISNVKELSDLQAKGSTITRREFNKKFIAWANQLEFGEKDVALPSRPTRALVPPIARVGSAGKLPAGQGNSPVITKLACDDKFMNDQDLYTCLISEHGKFFKSTTADEIANGYYENGDDCQRVLTTIPLNNSSEAQYIIVTYGRASQCAGGVRLYQRKTATEFVSNYWFYKDKKKKTRIKRIRKKTMLVKSKTSFELSDKRGTLKAFKKK